MSAGATLLKLQQIDLELARNKSELANMPELKELASKRKTYVKLKAEMTKLYAQRKDLDIELDDLNTTEIQTNNAIEAANSTEGPAIRDALASLNVPGLITGDLSFDENGDAVKTYAVIKTIKDGQIVYFSTYNG